MLYKTKADAVAGALSEAALLPKPALWTDVKHSTHDYRNGDRSVTYDQYKAQFDTGSFLWYRVWRG